MSLLTLSGGERFVFCKIASDEIVSIILIVFFFSILFIAFSIVNIQPTPGQFHVAFVLFPALLWSNTNFALQNCGAMQTLTRKNTETLSQGPRLQQKLSLNLIFLYHFKSLLFQRSIHPLQPL